MPHPSRPCVLLALAFIAALGPWPSGYARADGQVQEVTAVQSRLSIKEWQLPNGLRALLVEDHKAAVASVQIFYHVGSKDEHEGTRGVAHMFEHMMGQGSERVPPDQHARLLAGIGATTSASTTEDMTVFAQSVAPPYVDFVLALEADRMRGLKVFPAAVAFGRRTVMEERRAREASDPVARAVEIFRSLAFENQTYAWTPAGDPSDLDQISVAECQRFYDRFYAPNNATVVIVGDVHETEVKAQIERHFGPLSRGPDVPRSINAAPARSIARERMMSADVQMPVVIAGYRTPAALHPDAPALEVALGLLADGASSRIYQRLVRDDKLALGTGGDAQLFETGGLLLLYAVHLPSADRAKIRTALLDEVTRFRTELVDEHQVKRARQRLAARHIHALEAVDGIARDVGSAAYVLGDWHQFSGGMDRYLAVTAEDVQRVARETLVDQNLTLLLIKPEAPKAARPRPASPPALPSGSRGRR